MIQLLCRRSRPAAALRGKGEELNENGQTNGARNSTYGLMNRVIEGPQFSIPAHAGELRRGYAA